jgi:hypothetical protein
MQIPRLAPMHDAADCQPPQRALSGGSGYGISISRNVAAAHVLFRGFPAAILEALCTRSIIFELQ